MKKKKQPTKTNRGVPTNPNGSITPSPKVIITHIVGFLSNLKTPHYLVKEVNELYFFDGQCYRQDKNDEELKSIVVQELLQNGWFDEISSHQIDEIMRKYKTRLAPTAKSLEDFNRYSKVVDLVSGHKIIYFNLRNGILEFNTETRQKKMIIQGREKYLFLSMLNIDYNLQKVRKISVVSGVIRHLLPRASDRKLFFTFLAYTLLERDFRWQCVLMLFGYGKEGKSAILDGWAKLFETSIEKGGMEFTSTFGLSNVYDVDIVRLKLEEKRINGLALEELNISALVNELILIVRTSQYFN